MYLNSVDDIGIGVCFPLPCTILKTTFRGAGASELHRHADISQRLIESIFFKNSPMHDGAIIISNNKIKAARCVLPVTENIELPAHLGMRHRAAVGLTEQSDAIALAVSEETGEISISREGQIRINVSADELERYLREEFEQ